MTRSWRENLNGAHRAIGRARNQVELLLPEGDKSNQLWCELLAVERRLREIEESIVNEVVAQTRGGK